MKTIQLDRPKKTSQVASRDSQNNSQKTPQNRPSNNPQTPPQSNRYWAPNQKVCCCYVNTTARFQIIRLAHTETTDATHGLVERTVPPYASILFEANSQDRLEIHTGNLMSSIHSDTIPCHQLAHPNLNNPHQS